MSRRSRRRSSENSLGGYSDGKLDDDIKKGSRRNMLDGSKNCMLYRENSFKLPSLENKLDLNKKKKSSKDAFENQIYYFK